MLEVSENQDYPFGDIVAQPQTWHSIVDAAEAFAPLFYSRWLAQTGQEVIFTGCGSPYCLAQTAALLYQGMTGLAARAYPASEILRFPQLTLTGDPRLLVAFSRSGEDTETVGAVKAGAGSRCELDYPQAGGGQPGRKPRSFRDAGCHPGVDLAPGEHVKSGQARSDAHPSPLLRGSGGAERFRARRRFYCRRCSFPGCSRLRART